MTNVLDTLTELAGPNIARRAGGRRLSRAEMCEFSGVEVQTVALALNASTRQVRHLLQWLVEHDLAVRYPVENRPGKTVRYLPLSLVAKSDITLKQ